MSRPFPFPSITKDSPHFDRFMGNLLTSAVDLHRAVSEFELVDVPSSSTAPGKPGMEAYDEDYVYKCVAEDTWKRIPLSTW